MPDLAAARDLAAWALAAAAAFCLVLGLSLALAALYGDRD